jgi:adenosylhomocysteine nucleosidase
MSDLIVIALEKEAPQLYQHYSNVHVIGVGKVNAAINLTRLIYRYHPRRVINIGTAGGITVTQGIHRINCVRQHDANMMPIGLDPGAILNDADNTVVNLPGDGLVCASGDLFVTEPEKLRVPCDIIDMEAYSVARVCKSMAIDCEIWKYISDGADSASASTWQAEVKSGQDYYEQVLKDLNAILDRK